MSLHVFVAMPFGIKEGIDFDRVYDKLIGPALRDAGFYVFRADDEISAGNIRTDIFQELLLADLVVADLTLDNPNVWYELGVRHTLRARGVIQIVSSERQRMPFDVYTDRTLRYHLKDGAPDPQFLEQDKKALAEETPTWVLRLEARRMAGKALIKLGQFRLALAQYEGALEIDPTDLESDQQKGILLGRLGQHARAREHIEALLEKHPHDPETWCLLGRVEKEEWISRTGCARSSTSSIASRSSWRTR